MGRNRPPPKKNKSVKIIIYYLVMNYKEKRTRNILGSWKKWLKIIKCVAKEVAHEKLTFAQRAE